MHISPGRSYFASGVYRPRGSELRNIRQHIASEGMAYIIHAHHPDFVERFGTVYGEKLRSMPRGFHHYDHHVELLKMKQHLIQHHYTDEEVLSDTFVEEIKKDIQIAQPRSDWLNHAGTTPLQ